MIKDETRGRSRRRRMRSRRVLTAGWEFNFHSVSDLNTVEN